VKELVNEWVYLDLENKTGQNRYGRWVAVAYLHKGHAPVPVYPCFNRMLVDAGGLVAQTFFRFSHLIVDSEGFHLGIKEKLPLLNSDSRKVRLFGYVVYFCIASVIIGAILPSPEVDTSDQTKAVETQDQAPEAATETTTERSGGGSDDWRSSEPTNAYDWVIKGSCYETYDKDTARAIGCYEQALQLEPDNKDALASLAMVYGSRKDYATALSYLNRILANDPDDTSTLAFKALYLKKMGRPYDAIAACDRIIIVTPDDGSLISNMDLADAWWQKALIYQEMGNYDQYRRCSEMSEKYTS